MQRDVAESARTSGEDLPSFNRRTLKQAFKDSSFRLDMLKRMDALIEQEMEPLPDVDRPNWLSSTAYVTWRTVTAMSRSISVFGIRFLMSIGGCRHR